MKVKDIKQYIMTALIHKSEKLAICPTLLIDRLFDNLNVDSFEAIKAHMNGGSRDEQMQRVWDRYLVPTLMMADMNVKVFARDEIDPELTCTLKADKVDLTDLSDALKSAVKKAVLRRQGFLDDDNMVTFVNPLTKIEHKRKVVDF